MSSESWEAILDDRANLIKSCIITGNFEPLNDAIAQDISQDIDYIATLQKVCATSGLNTMDITDQLKAISLNTADEGKGHYGKFDEEIELAKKTKPNASRDEWEYLIDQKAGQVKKANGESIDKAVAAAKAKIRTLPHRAKVPAAKVFNKLQDGIVIFFKIITGGLEKVGKAIYEFMLGIWKKLELVWNTVKDGFNATIRWIKGLFGALNLDNMHTSAQSAFTTINSELGFILDELAGQKINVDHLAIQRTGDGWELCP